MTTGFGVELKTRTPTTSACEPFRKAIEMDLSHGRNAMAIWQDPVVEGGAGFQDSYEILKRFVRKLRGRQQLLG